jgi:hypothetical protein
METAVVDITSNEHRTTILTFKALKKSKYFEKYLLPRDLLLS